MSQRSEDLQSNHAIRKRAHAIWELEGCPEGRHDEHWRMAESELFQAHLENNEGDGKKAAREAKELDGLGENPREALVGTEGAALHRAQELGKDHGPGDAPQSGEKSASRGKPD
jgi:hypothetical protein